MGNREEKTHSWYLLIMSCASLFFVLFNKSWLINFLIANVMIFIFYQNGLSPKKIIKVSLYAFFFSVTIFLLSRINPGRDASLMKALMTMQKVFFISFLSICSAHVIDYTKVVLYLIVHKGLKLIWGYPILLALNSLSLLKEEYERITLNARLRNLPFKDRVLTFFPLLVFAIRHSQRGALSLVTRGLNDKKTFYFSYSLSLSDKKRLILFWLLYFALVVATQFQLG